MNFVQLASISSKVAFVASDKAKSMSDHLSMVPAAPEPVWAAAMIRESASAAETSLERSCSRSSGVNIGIVISPDHYRRLVIGVKRIYQQVFSTAPCEEP